MIGVHLLLELDVPLDDRCVDADGGREEPDGPELVPPGPHFDPRKPLADLPTRMRLDLPDGSGDRILRQEHRYQVDMVRLDADLFALDLGMVFADVARCCHEKRFQVSLEDPPPGPSGSTRGGSGDGRLQGRSVGSPCANHIRNPAGRTASVQWVLISARYSPYLQAIYRRLAATRGTGKAIIASVRKSLGIIYQTLKHQRNFRDYTNFELANG